MAEQGAFDNGRIEDYAFTTEHGPFGGLVMSNWQFSANRHPEALLDGLSQFDFIDGGNCEFAALAFAQFDSAGNVNVSKFGSFNPGAGGFIDIAHNARAIGVRGNLHHRGAADRNRPERAAHPQGGQRSANSSTAAEQITYPVRNGVIDRGQRAQIITERAVFEVTAEGLVLTEVAKGVDVRRDILEQMEFAPVHVADKPKLMDDALFAH